MKRFSRIKKQSKNEIPKLCRKLTRVFNAYIRNRDKNKGCISCLKGKVENAGHYRSTGAAPQASMRFDERNVNGQCIRCNYTLGGNPEGYKVGLVRRYGNGILQELEIKRATSKPWTRFEYEVMIKKYSGYCEEN